MKLIVQIPCLNEERTLPQTIKDIPREIEGVDEVEILVIDDGSTDKTVEVARELGVDHFIKFINTKGLAQGFTAGLDACIKLGADIIVNTDGDNQYSGKNIPQLIRPILDRKADIVIGDRKTDKIKHFSFTKRKLQKFGSWVVRQLSDTEVPDATSGFRAFSREAALKINIISDFSYTLETIIQAGKKNIAITDIPIDTNGKLRESRLSTSMGEFLKKSASTMVRVYATYEPLKIFFTIGACVFGFGFILGMRFLYYYIFSSGPTGHIQSLILASMLMILGFIVMMNGLVADLISANRKLIEDILYRIKKIEFSPKKDNSPEELT